MRHLFSTFILAFVFLAPIAQAQNLKKEWGFVHKEDGRMKQYKQGQKITVKWRGVSGIKTTKGRLADITADSLILSLDNYRGSIAKKDIEKIVAKRERSVATIMFSALLISAGIIVAAIFIVGQIIYNTTRTDYQLQRGEKDIVWPKAFWGLGLIALGILNLGSSTMQTFKPFGKDWMLQEIPSKIKNTP